MGWPSFEKRVYLADPRFVQQVTAYSIEHGGVGATCNPVIVVGVLKKETAAWKDRIRSLITEMPVTTEDQIGWQVVREISIMHWSEFIGGDVVISPPYAWQVRYNASDIAVVPRIDEPVDPKIVDELSKKFIDFRRAYTEDGLSIDTFDSFGPSRRTLRQFIAGCNDLGAIIRDFMLPEW
jgi:hypothetical protein